MNGEKFLAGAEKLIEGEEISPESAVKLLIAGHVDVINNQRSLKIHIDDSNKEMKVYISEEMGKRDGANTVQNEKINNLLALKIIKFNIWAEDNKTSFNSLLIAMFVLLNVWMVDSVRASVIGFLPFIPDNWVEFLTTGGV